MWDLSKFLFVVVCLIGTQSPDLVWSQENPHLGRKESQQFLQNKKVEWSVGSGLSSYEQGLEDGNAGYLLMAIRLELPLAKWIYLRVNPRADFYSARVQERFDSDSYGNRLQLLESFVGITPILDSPESLELRVGLLSQSSLQQEMLVSKTRAFPGFSQAIVFQGSHAKAALTAQQVMPTSYSLDSEREGREAMPSFLTETLTLNGRGWEFLDWKIWGGHFTWRDLPNKVAYESALWGNSVEGEVAPGARFRSKFNGWQGGLEACLCPDTSSLQLFGEFRRLKNTAAPEGLNEAQSWGGGPRILLGEHRLDLRYRRYFLEKDSTASVYNSSSLGGTNRQGDQVELVYAFTDLGFALKGAWTGSTPLRDNPFQQTMTSYFIGLETDYVPF